MAHVIISLGTGGAESMLIKLIENSYQSVTHHIYLLQEEHENSDYLRKLGVKVQTVNAFQLFSRLRKENFEIVIGWLFHGMLLTAFAKMLSLTNCKFVWNIRYSEFPKTDKKSKGLVQLLRFFSKFVDAIIYNSNSGKRHHEEIGYSTHNSIVIENGFDTELFIPNINRKKEFVLKHDLEANAFIFGMVARFDKLKNQINFINTAYEFLQNTPELERPIYFVFAGKNMLLDNEQIKVVLSSLNKTEHFIFLGEQKQLQHLYPCFDVHCLNSLTEGFPNVIGEAMSCGIPCISTNVGDVQRLLDSCGWLIPPNKKSALLAALTRAYFTPQAERNKLGQLSRKHILDEYSIKKIVNKYLDFFNKIIGT
ncbi:MAG: glycosyltransferase [Bdellovibrionales bacterium]|nr:glycosyltransferase [Bdellovibrionales bacterium]